MRRAFHHAVLLAAVALAAVAIPQAAGAQHLYYSGGRVVHHPRVHIVYFDSNWNAANPPEFSRANIEAWLGSFMGSNYFDVAGQYDTHSGAVHSAHESALGSAGGTTNSGAIHFWLTGEIELPGTGVPYPCSDDDLYVVLLPHGTTIDNGFNRTCDSFGAYHFFAPLYIPPFVCDALDVTGHLQSAPYVVIPVSCASKAAGANGFYHDFDALTMLLSHEIIEASTDPLDWFVTGIPVIGDVFSFIGGVLSSLGISNPNPGWFDSSLSVGDLFTKSEAADIPEFSPVGSANPEVWLNNSLVAAYWSNLHNDRAAGPGVVRTFSLQQSGVPGGLPVPVGFDGRTLDVNTGSGFSIQIATGTSHTYSYPTTVAGAPGVRYVTSDPLATATLPVPDTFTKSVAYGTEYNVAVSTSPAAAAVGNSSLTATGWYPAGTMAVTADQNVTAVGGARYDFRNWTGTSSSSSRSFSFPLTAPSAEVAHYALQYVVAFMQSGIAPSVPWNVTVAGTSHPGAYTVWTDSGATLTYAYQTPVPDLAPGTRYVLTGSAPASPVTISGHTNVSGTYKTQHLLSIATSGLGSNTTHLLNGGLPIGTASDGSPFSDWFDHGTALALSADALVDGAGGTSYFFQSFGPAPPAALNAPFATTALYETMDQLIADALAGGGISGSGSNGISTALRQKWAAVTADLAAGRYQAALGSIRGFLALLQAQSGSKITPALATTLQLDALMVYHSALCKAVAGGLLPAVQSAAAYATYSAQVLALGGSPLPPC